MSSVGLSEYERICAEPGRTSLSSLPPQGLTRFTVLSGQSRSKCTKIYTTAPVMLIRQSPLIWNGHENAENITEYTMGGFHPVRLGDVISSTSSRYKILHKLGQGAFSTVWLAEVFHNSPSDSQHYVALKICRADSDPGHEIDIFKRLNGLPNVLQLRNSFTLQGPNGVHTVLVHDVLGSLFDFLCSPGREKHARMLCRQIASGLAEMHGLGIVHGDLHTRNIGLTLPTLDQHPISRILDYFGRPCCTIIFPTVKPEHPEALPPYLVPPISIIEYMIYRDSAFVENPSLQAEIMDLGNAMVLDAECRPWCTPVAVCAPELVFELVAHSVHLPPTRAGDIWSLGCMIYELFFGRGPFYFASANDRLLGRMATWCGEVPENWKTYWNSRDYLCNITVSQQTADAEWQHQLKRAVNYKGRGPMARPRTKAEKAELRDIFDLLRIMLKIDPQARPSAEEVLKHPWFTRDYDKEMSKV